MGYTLPQLEYEYDALSPSISKDVMQLHHAKHHQAYVDKLNSALPGSNIPIDTLLRNLGDVDEAVRRTVRNNGGGHYNHSLFWRIMSPDGGGEPTGNLRQGLVAKYGSFQDFVDAFSTQASSVFGSGWVWLQPDLEIITTPNQDNPIMQGELAPILGLDVWEHAYYLDYRNVRADYIKAWWDVVDWRTVEQLYR